MNYFTKHISIKLCLMAFLMLQSLGVFAQPGAIDPTFGSFMTGINASIVTSAIQTDGKILIGGSFSKKILRLNIDGSIDNTFNTSGIGIVGTIVSITLSNDGKILIGGSFSSYNGISINNIVRLNADGSLDNSFSSTGSGPNTFVRCISIQNDGKILIGGSFTTYNNISRGGVARLNNDGSLDNTFLNSGTGIGGYYYNSINSIFIQSDGKVLLGGSFTTYNGVSRNSIVRTNNDGSLDNTFLNTGSGAGGTVYYGPEISSIAVVGNSKIILVGRFYSYNGVNSNDIVRINNDGSLDNTFLSTGSGIGHKTYYDDIIYSLKIQNDGKLLIGGNFTSYNNVSRNNLARLNSDGSPDNNFVSNTEAYSYIFSIGIQSNDKILISGNFFTYNGTGRNFIARINIDNTLDNTFRTIGTGIQGASFPKAYSIALQSNSKILIGGYFTTYNGEQRGNIARLNSDGSLDNTFLNTGSGANDYIYSIVIQGDGKVIIGGDFTSYNGISKNHIVRLNSDGSIDNTFLPNGTGTNGSIKCIALQGDGKILIGGEFNTFNNISRNFIARLNSDGSLDNTFLNSVSGPNGYIQSICVQNDGKILVGGSRFTTFNDVSRGNIARLNSDGSLDNTFLNTGSGANDYIYSIVVQGDGKVVIGGDFTSYNGISQNYIVRLNSDGSIDSNFLSGISGYSPSVYSIIIQNDGKIIIGGRFNKCNNISKGNIARLNIDGSLDNTFLSSGLGADYSVISLALQNDNKVLLGGDFSYYNGLQRDHIARILTTGTNCPAISLSPTTANNIISGTAFSQTFTASGGATPYTFSVSGTLPTGITLTSAGILSGTTTQSGTFNITITATDANGCTGSQAYALTPAANPPEINLKQGTTDIATSGTYAFGSQTIATAGSPVTFTIENTGTGALNLSGTPKVAISGTNAADFTVNQTATTATVAAGANTTFTVTFSPATTGAKTAQLSIANNDSNENPYLINLSGTGVTCTNPPVPTITQTLNPLAGTLVLTSSATSGNQWLKDGTAISGATNQTYNVTAAGSYAVKVTVSGCSSTSAATSLTAAEPSLTQNNRLQLYPNPASDKLTVSYLPEAATRSMKTTVYNLLGKKIGEQAMQQKADGTWETVVNTASLAQGSYIIRIQDEKKPVSKSFVKQ